MNLVFEPGIFLDVLFLSCLLDGAGITHREVPFSYRANWEAPGRWGLEVMTKKRRFYFRPLEKLAVQEPGSLAIESVELDDVLDLSFKPGFYRQVEAFVLGKESSRLLTIQRQAENMKSIYERIRGF